MNLAPVLSWQFRGPKGTNLNFQFSIGPAFGFRTLMKLPEPDGVRPSRAQKGSIVRRHRNVPKLSCFSRRCARGRAHSGSGIKAQKSFLENSLPETNSPCPALRPDRDQMGDGSAPRSLSRCRHWAPDWLPAPRRYSPRPAEFIRPRSRAVQRLALAEFRVRPLGSLGLVVAPPACKPGQDTSAI